MLCDFAACVERLSPCCDDTVLILNATAIATRNSPTVTLTSCNIFVQAKRRPWRTLYSSLYMKRQAETKIKVDQGLRYLEVR